MKKSVSPLSLKEPVQGVRKCIPPKFLMLFDSLRYCVTDKIFLIFIRNYYYSFLNLRKKTKNELWNRLLITVSFQRLYFTFDFKI